MIFFFLLLPLQLFAGENYLVILVEAPHFDFTSNKAFLRSMAKHPSNWSKNGDVGHAWIYLQGKGITLEGGQSGELGIDQPKYFEGIMSLVDRGCANPCQYLWETLQDGFFEKENGGHIPTFAASLEVSDEQFEQILCFIKSYDFSNYNLRNHQCCTFVKGVASIVGLELETEAHLKIEPTVTIDGEEITLWKDPFYQTLSFQCPDKVEESLKKAVEEGRAASAKNWYMRYRRPQKPFWKNVILFPKRIRRAWMFRDA